MHKAGIYSEKGNEKTGRGRRFSKLGFHSLRHSFTSGMANAGVPQEIRRELTGHASEEVHRKYTHFELQPLRRAIEQLPRLGSEK